MKKRIILSFLCCGLLFGGLSAFAATIPTKDSSQLNLSQINAIEATRGIPVGTVMAWSAPGNPDDANKWLECDGRSTAGYPELAAIVGSRTPNYKEQFLRGGNTGQVGQVTSDSTRSHNHYVPAHSHTVSGTASSQAVTVGSQKVSGTASGQSYNASRTGGSSTAYLNMDLDYYWGTQHNDGIAGIYLNGYGISAGGSGYSARVPISVPGVETYSAMTGGGSINGTTSGGNYNTGGGTITGWTNSVSNVTEATGGYETAPQHIRVRYLIRALP